MGVALNVLKTAELIVTKIVAQTHAPLKMNL